MGVNIIGDIAGQYDALMRLVDKMPPGKIVLVGDIIDRGPDSKRVVDWAMANATVVAGNHEQMMIDFFSRTEAQMTAMHRGHYWRYNGGEETLMSYGVPEADIRSRNSYELQQFARAFVPKEHVEWMRSRPLFYQEPGLLVTHAPVSSSFADWTEALKDDGHYEYGRYITWCRRPPCQRPFFQVFGHNSDWGLSYFATGEEGQSFRSDDEVDNAWAVCLDHSFMKVLTAITWPEKRIIQVPF